MMNRKIKNKLKKNYIYYVYTCLFKYINKKKIENNPQLFLEKTYKKICRRELNLEEPKTFTEKMQWMKLNDEMKIQTVCTDKVKVRDWIRKQIGGGDAEQYFPKCYGIYKNFEEIDFDKIPNKFVLKPNHSSGNILICTDKEKLDRKQLKKKTDKWLRENFYYVWAEPQYKDIEPCLICEELLEADIIDYRIFCFDGIPQFVRVTRHNENADSGYTSNFYDIKWKELGCLFKGDIKEEFECPDNWEEMLQLSERLSKEFVFVRVDLYETDGRVYFSELTFTPTGGLMRFVPVKFDRIYGDLLTIPSKH